MLRAMDELEKTVNDLLDIIQERNSLRIVRETSRSSEEGERGETIDQEAAQLVRRAIKRLKSL